MENTNDVATYYRESLRPLFKDQRFLHVGGVAAALTGQAALLEPFEPAQPFFIAGSRGTGPLPDSPAELLHVLQVSAPDMVEEHHRFVSALKALPDDVVDAIDAWDPEGTARWMGTILLDELSAIAQRPKFGLRRPEWCRLEDKTVIDAFWDQNGVAHPRCEVVALDDRRLPSIAAGLDQGSGTVWSADASHGMSGGSIRHRWVRTSAEVVAATQEMLRLANLVRIAPFLEGIPASISGIVFPEGNVVLRPVEMVVLRDATAGKFVYAGFSSWFDPSSQVRTEMRTIGRQVATVLDRELAYRGPFALDGIVTEGGFLPTELNPRIGGTLGYLGGGIPEVPLIPLCWAATEGLELDYRPVVLEEVLLKAADQHRFTCGRAVTQTCFDQEGQVALTWRNGVCDEATSHEEERATLTFGPSGIGGFLSVDFEKSHLVPGQSIASLMTQVLEFCDRRLQTRFGRLDHARPIS